MWPDCGDEERRVREREARAPWENGEDGGWRMEVGKPASKELGCTVAILQ